MRRVVSILFNTFLVTSALVLAFVVLQREERYAMGQVDDPDPAAEQPAAQGPTAVTPPPQ